MYLSSNQTGLGQAKKNDVDAGRQLYAKLNCASCHSINEVGGCIAPPLANVTKRRSAQYIRLRLDATKEDEFIVFLKHPELFPHPRFRPGQVQSLMAYLGTLDRKSQAQISVRKHKVAHSIAHEEPTKKPFAVGAQTTLSREGHRLYLQTGCMACHSVGNTGGSIGPALDGIGARHTRQYIEAHISDPYKHLKAIKKGKANSAMVQPDLFPDQVKALTDFLLTLPD